MYRHMPGQETASGTARDELLGPEEAPNCAVASQSKGAPEYAYRICRRGENPWALREPADLAGMTFQEQRALLVTAVATGNNPARPSPFLHASRSLRKVLLIWGERRHLYSNFLVRWPRKMEDVVAADFENIGTRQRWFHESDSDSALLADCVSRCHNYTEKDSEIVYFSRPRLEKVQWWDAVGKVWRGCMDDSAISQAWRAKLQPRAEQASSSSSASSSYQACPNILRPLRAL